MCNPNHGKNAHVANKRKCADDSRHSRALLLCHLNVFLSVYYVKWLKASKNLKPKLFRVLKIMWEIISFNEQKFLH